MSRFPQLLTHALLALLLAVAPLQGLLAGDWAMADATDPIDPIGAIGAIGAMTHDGGDADATPDLDGAGPADDLCDCCPVDQTPSCANCAANHCSTGHCSGVAILGDGLRVFANALRAFAPPPFTGLPSASPSPLFRPPRA
jgi:hypothetical protein